VHPVNNNFSSYASSQDSHPTGAGGQKATGEFVEWLNVHYNRWAGGGGGPNPTPSPTPTATTTGTPPTPTATETPSTGTITLQQGVDAYDGMTDTILADDVESDVNLGGLDHIEAFRGETEEYRRSLMRWDLSSLPDGATINSATLELYRYESDIFDPIQITLHTITHAWVEGTQMEFWPEPGYTPDGATWETCDGSEDWGTSGGDYTPVVVAQTTLNSGAGAGWVSLDVTSAMQAWVQSGTPNYGLLMRPHSGHGYCYFASGEYENNEYRPRLTINYSTGGTPGPKYTIHLPLVMR
jgi:hypothetical protein